MLGINHRLHIPTWFLKVFKIQENVELKKGLEMVLEENRKLKERWEGLENSRCEEDQKFSTPDGETKEAVRPPPTRLLDK